METVNVDQWVKGGELILTSSSTFPKSKEDLTSLIETLKQKHATCLAIKVIEEDRPSKDELEALTENLEFPILWIPHNVTYLEIMNYVNSMLFNIKEYNDFRERATYNIIFNNGTIDSLIVDSFKSYDVDITNLDCLVANFNFKADSKTIALMFILMHSLKLSNLCVQI
ncbi:PucR family transcriptional regulator ligand-binding domain-containing protein [Erysipelothrix sp. D19-032]